MNPTKRALGCYVGIVVAAFSMMLLAAAIIELAAVVLINFCAGPRPVFNLISLVTSVPIAYALTMSFATQMNQLGNVVAGLDDASSLSSFFSFVAVSVIALVLSIVNNFLGKAKAAA